MSDNQDLTKYLVQGRVDEELDKEVDQALEPAKKPEPPKTTQPGKIVPAVLVDENQLKLSLVKKMVEALTEQSMYGPTGTGTDETDPKIKVSRALTQTVSDALWKISDFDRKGSDMDDLNAEIQKELKMSYNKVLRLAVKKLYDTWWGGDSEEEKKEPEKKEPEKEEPKLQLQIIPNEQIKSPTGETLKIEEILGDKVKLQKANGEFVLADLDSVKKWAGLIK
jgi:hypothetical protein